MWTKLEDKDKITNWWMYTIKTNYNLPGEKKIWYVEPRETMLARAGAI